MMLSVVMPVFNEEKTIEEIIRKIQVIDVDKEIIIVDDFSTDRTRDILKSIKEKNIKILI